MSFIEPHLIPTWTQHVNDTIHKQMELFPRRSVGAAQVPMISEAPDPGNGLDVVDRCVSEHGFMAVYVSPDPAGRRTTPAMRESYWFPLYEKCQAMRLPIIVHATNTQDPRHRIIPLGYFIEEYWASQFLSHAAHSSGPHVLIVAYRPPLLTAKLLTMLDVLSGGAARPGSSADKPRFGSSRSRPNFCTQFALGTRPKA